MIRVFPHGAIELKIDGEASLKVNGMHMNNYLGNLDKVKVVIKVSLCKV